MASKVQQFYKKGNKIIGMIRSYRDHAVELGNPVPKEPIFFLKPRTSYITEGQSIQLPLNRTEIHHEVELGVIIGKEGSCISESSAMDHIGGYCLALDMTDRIAQKVAKDNGLPWTLAKGFDTSCPVSDFIPKENIPDPHNMALWLKVNGELRQEGNTKDLIFTIPQIISHVSNHIKLEEGDLILTGTPEGVGPVVDGDIIMAGLSKLANISFPVTRKSNH